MSKELREKISDEIVTFWASATDALLQEFKDLGAVGSEDMAALERKVMAVAKLSQLGLLMHQYFDAGLKSLGPPQELKEKCMESCYKVKNMVDKHLDEIEKTADAGDSEPDTIRNPRLMN